MLKSVLMRLMLGFDQSLLDEGFRVLGLFRNDTMLAKNIVPISFQENQLLYSQVAGVWGCGHGG